MSKLCWSLIASLTIGLGFGLSNHADGPKLLNLDFEQGEVGKTPPGWFVPKPTLDAGFRAEVSDTYPKQGKRCAVLISGDRAGFGNLMTSFDAKPYRGKQVRFKAAVKSGADDSAPVMFWVRVDRAKEEPGFFDNMADRPITKKDWNYYEHVGEIAADAATINLGLMFNGTGKAWIDNVTLEDLGHVGAGNKPPAPLSQRGLANLVAFAKLVGYVRFFHPSDEAAKAKWDQFVVDYVELIEAANNPDELVATLNSIFHSIAPAVAAFKTGDPPPAVQSLPDTVKGPVYWRHDGVKLGDGQSIYGSKRITAGESLFGLGAKLPKEIAVPNPRDPMIIDLGGGVSCSVPIGVFIDEKGSLPRPSVQSPESKKPKGFIPTGNDRSTRLADVILAWNVFQHFYPYFEVVEVDWSAELPKALNRAATDKDEAAFLETLKRLIAALKDGHGNVMLGNANRRSGAFPPLRWDWIEGKLVITYVDKDKVASLQPGDVITSINGVPADQALAKAEELISGATPQWRRHNALIHIGSGDNNSELDLVIDRAGEKKQVGIRRTLDGGLFFFNRNKTPEKITEIKPGIWYVDIDRIKDSDFTEVVPKLEKATGIIFDLRGYPSQLGTLPISHITDKPVTCAQWHIPVVVYPDRQKMGFSFSNWTVPPRKPRFNAKVAFITDGRAISYAETYLGIIEHYKLAEIVGSPTAGTNGNVNPCSLPGGYRISWTGMNVLKHDGSTHHGIGIQPTVPVQRTIHGVKVGKDELLEKAISVVGGS